MSLNLYLNGYRFLKKYLLFKSEKPVSQLVISVKAFLVCYDTAEDGKRCGSVAHDCAVINLRIVLIFSRKMFMARTIENAP